MSTYEAPLKDMQFVICELAGLDQVTALPGWQETDKEVVNAILQEASRFASEVLTPLNRVGDQAGVIWKDGNVIMAPGFREAYQSYIDTGWNRLGFEAEYGGQAIPSLVGVFRLLSAHPGSDRGLVAAWNRRSEKEISTKNGGRPLDRHNESN